ncbi:MAG TPA: zinc-dependent metalloprotease [Acidimicrobiales bacterium]|nr:zinc-dependent metalloprotease [Acidimicrobiales bacterium]
MSEPDFFGAGGLPEGGPFGDLMRNLARLFTSQGPVNWEIARQMALWAATGGQPESNVDPVARVRMQELVRVAELHVGEATGLAVSTSGVLTVRSVTASEWALRTLEAWKPQLEALAARMNSALAESGGTAELGGLGGIPGSPEASAGGDDPMAKLFANLPQVLGPFLFGLQAGSMVGQLATRAMGQYDLPVPRPASDELLVVPAAVDAFASDWSIEPDDARMWVCLREAAHHAVLGRPHVRARLDRLIGEYIAAFDPNPSFLEDRLGGVDPTDMGSLQDLLGDPETLLGEMESEAQRQVRASQRCVLCAVVGYVDHVMDSVGRRLIGSYGPITEALRRRRLEESSGTRILGKLFGVVLDESGYETGRSFVRGITERAGEEGLARLWASERELPTQAELSAPGLWLARIDLPDS